MNRFRYASATSTESARELVGANGVYLAGGNDLLGLMKESIAEPDILVNLRSVPGLDQIEPGDAQWVLGAGVTVAQIEDHPGLRQAFPGLHEAAAEVASRQIRNVATLGGNLAQHSRCWYYRHRDIYCLKKGGDTCHAREGENKFHSIFSGNPCISPMVSSLAVILTALDATVVVQREGETVTLTMTDLYQRAWDNPTLHHSLDRSDLILRVEVPTRWSRSAYLQVAEKAAFDWATVSCAAAVRVADGRIQEGRVVLGSVAPVPYQVAAANRLLQGQTWSDALGGSVAERLLRDATPFAHNGHKVPIARALIQRALRHVS